MSGKLKIAWWQWPNVLAIDAALVGMGWLWLLGWHTKGTLWTTNSTDKVQLGVMGLSIWLVYTADRWLDAKKLGDTPAPTLRHTFMQANASAMMPAWRILLGLDVALAVIGLSIIQFEAGIALLILCGLHMWLIEKRYFALPLKEAVIGIAFGGSIIAFLWNSQPVIYIGPDTFLSNPQLVLVSGLFALLCFTNCVLIAERERDLDQAMGRTSLARQIPGLKFVWCSLAFVAGWLGMFLLSNDDWRLSAPLAATGTTLGLLGLLMPRIPTEVFRVLADTAMLTPWLVLAFG